jgi:hypothetical protein
MTSATRGWPIRALIAASVVQAMGPASSAEGQTIAQRVAQAPDGAVRMSFTARPGVCGDGHNISTSRNSDEWESGCASGPVRVSLSVRAHRVTSIRTYVGGRWRTGSGSFTDLGMVSAPEAAGYLLDLELRLDSTSDGHDAILPATLADSSVVWPRLLAIARNANASRKARRQAVFWVGQAASVAATRGLDSLVYQDSLDRYVKEQAVFALSQRPQDEAVPALIRVARTHPDPAIRKKALFWLSQSEDSRALSLFQEILSK